jgi:hypothetical protein
MITRLVLPWLLLPVLAYTPTAPEILNRMEATLGRAKPVQVQLIREDPGGKMLEEKTETIPADGLEAAASSYLDVPFAMFTGSKESLADAWPFLTREETPVLLDRISGAVCYLLEGNNVRLWIDKATFAPLRIEIRTPSPDNLTDSPTGSPPDSLTDSPTGSSLKVTDYLEMINISEKVRYPARTEVHQDDTLLIVERILPATAGSEGP